ncbi:MAG: hypothetical protein AAFU61_01295, partial [Pseudomonadota bacterium]
LTECRLTTSWMRSEAGRSAWREGPLVAAELLAFFARTPKRRPPGPDDMRAVHLRADDRRGRLAGARRRREAGVASPADLDAIVAAERETAAAERMIFGQAEVQGDG